MANSVDDIAAKWNAHFAQPDEPVEAVEEESEPIGKGNVIPSAGNQPRELTPEQQKALLNAGKTNTQLLAEMLANQNESYRWYGPQQ